MPPDPQLNLTVIATATLERLLTMARDSAAMLMYAANENDKRRGDHLNSSSYRREAELTRDAIAAVRAEIAASDDEATTLEASR